MAQTYSIRELSKLLGRHHTTVRRFVAEGLIPFQRNCYGHLVFDAKSLRVGRQVIKRKMLRVLGTSVGHMQKNGG